MNKPKTKQKERKKKQTHKPKTNKQPASKQKPTTKHKQTNKNKVLRCSKVAYKNNNLIRLKNFSLKFSPCWCWKQVHIFRNFSLLFNHFHQFLLPLRTLALLSLPHNNDLAIPLVMHLNWMCERVQLHHIEQIELDPIIYW